MATVRQSNENSINLEAPGVLLSELLGVCEASALHPEAGSVLSLSSASGFWRILSPASGSVSIAWGDRAWTLSAPQAAVFPGGEELSLLAGEDCSLLVLVLQGMAADRVLSACRREGGLFFENGGVAVEHVFSLLSSGGSAAGKASEASEAAYGLLMSFYGSQSAEPGAGKRLPLVVEAALGIIRRDYAFLDGIGELAERLEYLRGLDKRRDEIRKSLTEQDVWTEDLEAQLERRDTEDAKLLKFPLSSVSEIQLGAMTFIPTASLKASLMVSFPPSP